MPFPFNKAMDQKLILLVKENEVLYAPQHPKSSDYDLREVIWQKIGDELNRPAAMCKSRWVNIRDMYRRRIRERVRNPNRSYNYKYEDDVAFMLPYFKDINTNNTEDYAEFEEDTLEISSEFVDANDVHETKPIPVFRAKKDETCNLSQSYSQSMNQSDNTSIFDLNSTDPIDVFLMTIGTTLRKFTPYYLNQAKSKIFQVVQDYELQQIVSKDTPSGSSEGANNDAT